MRKPTPLAAANCGVWNSAGGSPVGVQVVAGRYREDLCLAAGEVIEAAGPAVEIAEPVAR